MVTYNKELLMAFVYFDQSHCGYLLERDLEEILYTLGLHLSRAQVNTHKPNHVHAWYLDPVHPYLLLSLMLIRLFVDKETAEQAGGQRVLLLSEIDRQRKGRACSYL